MNQYFKAAVERYKKFLPKDKKESGFYINPMSEIDCEIIVELSELLKKAGNEQAIAILKEYKGNKNDSEIRDELIQCNIDTVDIRVEEFEENEEDGSKKSRNQLINTIKKLQKLLEKKRDFMIIDGERIMCDMIFGYEPKDVSTMDDEEFQIILNPTRVDATKIPLYANKTFTFYNEEEWSDTIQVLDKQLQQSNVKFVNKEDIKGDNGD